MPMSTEFSLQIYKFVLILRYWCAKWEGGKMALRYTWNKWKRTHLGEIGGVIPMVKDKKGRLCFQSHISDLKRWYWKRLTESAIITILLPRKITNEKRARERGTAGRICTLVFLEFNIQEWKPHLVGFFFFVDKVHQQKQSYKYRAWNAMKYDSYSWTD